MIELAESFTLDEIITLLDAFDEPTSPVSTWQVMAQAKLADLDAQDAAAAPHAAVAHRRPRLLLPRTRRGSADPGRAGLGR